MLDRDSALRGSAGDIQFNQAIETSTFLPLSGGKGGGGKALFTSRNDIAGYSGRPQRDGNDPILITPEPAQRGNSSSFR